MALVLAASAAWLAAPAQRVFDMDLWQGKVKVKGSDPADTAKVRVFLPEAKNATGRAVVICPEADTSIWRWDMRVTTGDPSSTTWA